MFLWAGNRDRFPAHNYPGPLYPSCVIPYWVDLPSEPNSYIGSVEPDFTFEMLSVLRTLGEETAVERTPHPAKVDI